MADEVKQLEEVEEKLLLWVKKHDKVMSENYKLKDEIKIWEEQGLKKLAESSLNLEKIKGLEEDLKEQEFCYKLAASRAKKYKAQLTIVKEAINL